LLGLILRDIRAGFYQKLANFINGQVRQLDFQIFIHCPYASRQRASIRLLFFVSIFSSARRLRLVHRPRQLTVGQTWQGWPPVAIRGKREKPRGPIQPMVGKEHTSLANAPRRGFEGSKDMMSHAQLTEFVRRLVAEIFSRLHMNGAQATHESILIRQDAYCGRRFDAADGYAIWFVEEGQVKVFGASGHMVEVLELEKQAPVRPTQRMAA